MAITWITPAGTLVPTITERVITSIPIQARSPNGPITFTLIAGRLPRGLRINRNIQHNNETTTGTITGSPVEVRRFTESRFVIRADDGVDIEDRTFSISVDGADNPEWITREGFLNVGPAKAFFVLDNAYVNFQLQAYDPDLLAGETLEFFLMPFGGQLPPGLSLSKDGVISGFTDPIFSLEYATVDTGGFDTGSYDISPLDFGKNSTKGYDSFIYDSLNYDFGETPTVPRRLSRIYTFAVGVTDGLTIETRIFKIFVVTEEFLKADNSLVEVDTNLFTADSGSGRIPIWITESDLGRFRANNYVTIFLDVYDPPSLPGFIVYFLLPSNPDGSPSEIPPGLELDTNTGELAGRVPYQDRVSKKYTFTMRAVDFVASVGETNYTIVGNWNTATTYLPGQAVIFAGNIYLCLARNKNRVPSDQESFWAIGNATADKTFTVEVIGEIESGVRWISGSDLGTIKPNRASDISILAESQLYGGRVVYELVSGSLPPGLSFLPNGLIVGKVRQFAQDGELGLTRFYDVIDGEISFDTTFDGGSTTFNKQFRFTVRARDTAFAAENFRDFFITVVAETDKTFANVWVKAFQEESRRLTWYDFISDISIFDPRKLYRYGDPYFGVQNEIKMLVFGGIESVEAVKYVQAMSRNHYRKRFLFGDLKMAKAKDPLTQEPIYEVIYVDVVDEYEKNGVSISSEVNLRDTINSKVLVSYDAITVDSDIPYVSDSDHQRVFPNSVKNMRSRLRTVGDRDRDFLPLWMRSIQDQADYELGYTKALVLCYAKPGESDGIMAKIRASGFDFKMINFLSDRYIIDALDGELGDKYLAFPQRGEKRP
jgi:hypothetical protein